MAKQSITNKVKGQSLKGEDVKAFYEKPKKMKIKPINDKIEVNFELEPKSQELVRKVDKAIENVQEKHPDVTRAEAFKRVREKSFSDILNDMLSSPLDEEYCAMHDIEYAPGLSGKEMIMMKQAENAMQGDLNAAKFIVDRIDGKAKSISENKSISVKGSLEDFMKRIDKNG